MTRRNVLFVPLAALMLCATIGLPNATAQNQNLLAAIYGRGVHAYYAGQLDTAYNHLSSAINAGSTDPRAHYFRGIVAYQQGRSYEAEADWNQGALIEAQAGGAYGIGRSLSRFQGPGRLKLEEIREKAKLDHMATAAARSDVRRSELEMAPAAPSATQPAAPQPSAAAPAAPVEDNPFGENGAGMSSGQPKLQSDNAMAGLDDNPFKDDAAPGGAPGGDAMAPAGGDPFGAPSAPAGDDPFGAPSGGSAPAPDDPFGAPAGGGDDPFGGSSMGGDGDPFGGDPFGG